MLKIFIFGLVTNLFFMPNSYSGGGERDHIKYVDLMDCRSDGTSDDRVSKLIFFERYDGSIFLDEGIHMVYRVGAELSVYGKDTKRIFKKDESGNISGLSHEDFEGILALDSSTLISVSSKISYFWLNKKDNNELSLQADLGNFGGVVLLSCQLVKNN